MTEQTASTTATSAALLEEVNALEYRWRNEADVNDVFNGLIAALSRRVLAAVPVEQTGYALLRAAATSLDEQMADPDADPDDTAEEVINCMRDLLADA